MPVIFTERGFHFFFYSNDHEPIHVHVSRGSGEAVFSVDKEVVLRESVGMKVQELAQAEQLAQKHRELIVRTWHEYFD